MTRMTRGICSQQQEVDQFVVDETEAQDHRTPGGSGCGNVARSRRLHILFLLIIKTPLYLCFGNFFIGIIYIQICFCVITGYYIIIMLC